MIDNFRHRGLKRLYQTGDKSKLRPDIADKAERFLSVLDEADCLDDINLPGYGLHTLTGNKRGFYSVNMSRNHRIIFRFEDGMAYDVDLVDYH
ncbi:proteic killer suppression protein [Nitrosomonas aestuarii]|uniref:Proteic killer suppression protein n=1 Tax=Nitrosomonas aestuarii TaxID=52441 RepID=A0A1I4GSI8_9PROT|nr:type II toxin-antitoxin system RelE/ParE family toxin [Nitrosomonas aestuarii]SFL32955.1 proteic killer suppression protein [Nitrosomonas aestuarii]